MSRSKHPSARQSSPKISRRDLERDASLRGRLGLEIQRRRLARGWTQDRLSDEVGLSLKYLGEIERGEANPSLTALQRIADTLDWNPLDTIASAEPITERIRQKLIANCDRGVLHLTETREWLLALAPGTPDPLTNEPRHAE